MSARYIGMDARTGRRITDHEHYRQSLSKIFMTGRNSRVMRRDFGTTIPDLIDQPLNAVTRMRLIAATVMAAKKWEPRLSVSKSTLSSKDSPSGLYADIDYVELEGPNAGKPGTMTVALKD